MPLRPSSAVPERQPSAGSARALNSRPARRRAALLALALVLVAAGAALFGLRIYLEAKARVAAVLIGRAWDAHRRDGRAHPPWPWADMSPVARLEVPRLGVQRVVLSNASGSALAFGLGHVGGTSLPGGAGHSAVAGHRDTWAAFLRRLRVGDEIRAESAGARRRYRVVRTEIVSKHRVDVLEPHAGARLTLITCYPFTGLLRSPWRYVVTCVPDGASPPLPG